MRSIGETPKKAAENDRFGRIHEGLGKNGFVRDSASFLTSWSTF
ncbi:hypothetical protein BRO54_2092 [Geobacillus proteiniphilus]|uniref:Uncharacterized protein n=1 Tax=Geobacillus proteiniphilus TaxID=860353 RepID=A0A1Q5SYD9_9BACL|nr:hypothetical protein BRO54_2092 [Geobacillus proteiniphilus]